MLPLFNRRDKRNVDYALTRARTFSVQPMKTKEPIAAKRKLNDNPIRPRSENMQSVPSAGKRVEANSTLALILFLIGREKSIMMLGCVWVKTESGARCFSSVSRCGCGFGFQQKFWRIDGFTYPCLPPSNSESDPKQNLSKLHSRVENCGNFTRFKSLFPVKYSYFTQNSGETISPFSEGLPCFRSATEKCGIVSEINRLRYFQ